MDAAEWLGMKCMRMSSAVASSRSRPPFRFVKPNTTRSSCSVHDASTRALRAIAAFRRTAVVFFALRTRPPFLPMLLRYRLTVVMVEVPLSLQHQYLKAALTKQDRIVSSYSPGRGLKNSSLLVTVDDGKSPSSAGGAPPPTAVTPPRGPAPPGSPTPAPGPPGRARHPRSPAPPPPPPP